MRRLEIASFLGRAAFHVSLLYSAILLVGALVIGYMVPAQRLLLVGGCLGVFALLIRLGRFGDLRISRNVVMVGAMVLAIVSALAFQWTHGYDEIDILGRSSFDFARTAAVLVFSWLAIGMAAESLRLDAERGSLLGFSTAIAVLAVVGFQGGGAFQVDYEVVNAALGDVRIDHLSLQDSVVLLLLFSYAKTAGIFRIGVILAAFASLFMLGGRAAFFIFSLSILLSMWVKGMQLRAVLYALAGLGALYLVVSLMKDNSYLPDGVARMLFIGGVSEDRSNIARWEILRASYDGLLAQVAFGDPGALVRNFGTMGAYIHNLLSVWQFYGVVPFFIVVVLTLEAVRQLFERQADGIFGFDDFGSAGLAYSVISVLVAKSLMFGLFWFFLGYWTIRASRRAGFRLGRDERMSAA